jgi:molecular chaperone GrpE
MVKKTKKDTKESSGAEAEAHAEAGAENAHIGEVHDDLERKLQEKSKEAAENYDRYLRAVADLDNYKKRAVKEKAEAINYGNEKLIRDLLPLVDNIDRALKHAETSCDFEAFTKGLAMLQTQLICSLEKHGVEAIDCANKAFDPNYHEALMQVPGTDHETNQIVDELEKGYLLHGRLLRPSKVSVCKRPDYDNNEK